MTLSDRDPKVGWGRTTAVFWSAAMIWAAVYLPSSAGARADETVPPRIVWHRDLGRGIEFAPLVDGDECVVALVDGKLISIDLVTKDIQWERKPTRTIASRPALTHEAVYAAAVDGRHGVFRMNRDSGKVPWRKSMGGMFGGACVLERGVVLGASSGRVVCLDHETGESIWEAQLAGPILHPLQTVSTPVSVLGGADMPVGASVLVSGGADTLYLLDGRTGSRVWTAGVPGRIAGTAVVWEDRIFVAGQGGGVRALALEDAAVLWQLVTREPLASGPVPDSAGLYVVSPTGRVRRFACSDGRLEWVVDLETVLVTPPTPVSGELLVGTLRGTLHGLDAESGRVRWRMKLNGSIEAPIVTWDGLLLAVTDRGDFYVLEP